MPSHADKSPKNQNRAVANQPSSKKEGSKSAFSFVDNRLEAKQIDRIQAMMNNSPQTEKLVQLQAMINHSPRMVGQRQQIDRMFGAAAQRQESPQEEKLQMKAKSLSLQRQPEPEEEGLIQGKFASAQRLVSQIQSQRAEAVQTKLTVGPAGDQYEQEADQVAKQVVGMISSTAAEPTAQRQGEEDELQMKPLAQRRVGVEGGSVGSEVEASVRQARGMGKQLPEDLRSSMEGAFGADFSGVRVHTDPEADALNESVSARAFTTGSDIFLRQGEYNPGSTNGKELLAHELTHVVQQGGVGALDASRMFAPGSVLLRKVVTVGTEKVDVDSMGDVLTEKGNAEKAEAQVILTKVKDTFGVDISSAKLIEGIKDQYTNVPTAVTDSLETREWKMIELRSIAKALENFAPILGAARGSSTRSGEDQEVTALGKVKNAIDMNTPAGQLDTTTLGEFFKGKKVMGIFKSSEGAKPDFTDEGDQLVGTFVHETAHGLLSYAYDDFVAASDGFWTDQNTKSGKVGAENPPTGYGKKNAREDMCETAMLYFVEPSRLDAFPKRLAFMKGLGTSWVPPVKDAPQVTK